MELTLKDKELLDKLKAWNKSYRTGEADISDEVYDAHKVAFAEKHPNHPFVVNIEPFTFRGERKQKLPIPMRSLKKLKTLKEVSEWLRKNNLSETDYIAIGPKFDGGSLLDDSITGAAFTRGGDENEGQRSDNHLKIINAPNNGPLRFTGGEFIISRANWDTYWKGQTNPRDGKEYKTLRGTVLGLLNNDTPSLLLKHVDYFRYYSDELEMGDFRTMMDELNKINAIDVPQYYIRAQYLTDELMNSLYSSWNKDYEIDGLVINVVTAEDRQRLGRDERTGNPNYAMAYKGDFEERIETTVNSVNCKVSKQRFLKPTVALERVILSGAEVSNPTGYNMKWIVDNNIAKGSKVVVKRSGEVIPKIIETVSYDEEAMGEMLAEFDTCPACGSSTEWNSSYVELMCSNERCKGAQLAKIVSFFEILGFEEFAESAIEKLFNAGYQIVARILNLTHDEVVAVDGLGDATASQLIDQVRTLRSGSKSLAKIMHASGEFTGIGSTKLQLILDNLPADYITEIMTYDNYAGLDHSHIANLNKVKGLADKTIAIFEAGIKYFPSWYASTHIDPKYIKTPAQEPKGSKYLGVTACFSGVRDKDLEKAITEEGGEVKKSYSKKITHLIVANPNSTNSKVVKAKEDPNCHVLTIEQFKDL